MKAVVVLAAGQSKRMNGVDKLMLDICGKPMYYHALMVCKMINPDFCVVVTNNKEIEKSATEFGFNTVKSPNTQNGMGNSVAEGVKALPYQTECAVFINADQPMLKHETVEAMINLCTQTDKIIVPRAGDRPCSPCVFPHRYFDKLKALCGENGGREVWKKHIDNTQFYKINETEAIDIDTVDAYNKAAHRLT